jgi:hypothetical protein
VGLSDATALLDENAHRFEALLQPLREVESSVQCVPPLPLTTNGIMTCENYNSNVNIMQILPY